MSATRNTESLASQNIQFHSRVPPSEPLTTKGHKPGVKVGNDAAPEFHVETYPAGTAPRENAFEPQTESEIPGRAANPEADMFTTDARESLPGATSQQVHTGLGKPLQGQEGRELHGEHRKRKKEGTGIASRGGSTGEDTVRQLGADLPEGVSKGTRGKFHPDYPGAEERIPESAETVASEYQGRPSGRAYDYSANSR
ncbi:hypothetical protein BX600DRAFT_475241 [Xylariales sp. PMI_506]|nr:hypothetical protein BX600DRAFT_475241 [Xylariales sp. PMI_506]